MINRNFSFEDTVRYVEFVKSQIDKSWLNKQFEIISPSKSNQKSKNPTKVTFTASAEKRAHPLAQLIYIVSKQINEAYKKPVFVTTEEILKLTSLGENLYFLSLHNTLNLDTKIKELMSNDKALYEKTYYEIQVAATYSHFGHHIEFVETQSDAGQRTPDLLVSDSVEVECKKKDNLSKRDLKNINIWEEMIRNASILMNKHKYNYAMYINTLTDPQASDVQFIIWKLKDLIKDKSAGTFFYEEKGITIHLTFVSDANQEFLANQFQVNVPEEMDYATQDMEVMRVDDKTVKFRKPRFFGFKSEIIPDRIQSVIASIKDATQQLTGTKPGLIYVNLNQLDTKLVQSDFDRLEKLVRDRLRQNSTITAVILTTEVFQKEELGIKHIHKARVIKNSNSKFSLPTNFTIIGDHD